MHTLRRQTLSCLTTARSLAAKSLLLALAATFALVGSSAARAQGSKMKPIAIVTLNSVSNLLEDINFAGSLAGQPRLADQVRPFVGMIQGLDNDQPIGVVIQSDGMNPGGAICIPCTDLKMMLGGLAMFGVTSEDGPNGTTQISAQGQTVFAREADGWAYISMMPQMLDDVPANPGELFGELTKDYDLAVRVNVQNIPEAFKQMAISQLEAGMQSGMKQLDHESDEQFEARKNMTQLQAEQLKQAVQDLDELTLGIALDSEKQRTYLDMSYTAVAGSKLAEQVAINSDPKTDFAGFFQPDAAMTMSFASKVSKSDIAQMEQMFAAAQKQVDTAIDDGPGNQSEEDREIIKSAVGDFMLALKSTLQAGKMDGGAVLNVSPGSLSLVAGGFVGDPAKVESGVKKLSELAMKKDAQFSGFNWNAASHDDVQFHTLNIPIPNNGDEEQEKARQLFGETVDIAVGIGKQSVYFALGRDCLEAVKGVMDTSAASPQKSVPPMEMSFALAQIMETVAALADGGDKAEIEQFAQMLGNEANGRDHVRMVAQVIPNGARFRLELEEGVLRAIGMGAMKAQMEAAGAGGPGGF